MDGGWLALVVYDEGEKVYPDPEDEGGSVVDLSG